MRQTTIPSSLGYKGRYKALFGSLDRVDYGLSSVSEGGSIDNPVRPPKGTPTAHIIFIRYALIAVLSGVTNFAAQEATVRFWPSASVMISILIGTAIGFSVKYFLEKRFVFFDNYVSHNEELRKIATYGLFSVGTTLLFWLTELSAWNLWGTAEAKYIGGALGYVLGNWIKYTLDKQWVFGRTK